MNALTPPENPAQPTTTGNLPSQPQDRKLSNAAVVHQALPVPALDITSLRSRYESRILSVEQAVRMYMARVVALDRAIDFPLQSILTINPNLLLDAIEADRKLRSDAPLPPLFGVPVVLKDVIETREMATTAGSLVMGQNAPGRDATIVTRLREAGAIIFGKANMCEWSGARSFQGQPGWSALGGQTRNPHCLFRSPGSSSSGSAAAVAAMLTTVAVGTDTCGSILNPASYNGLVGMKPTMGLIPRTHMIPVAHSSDMPGPITRTVRDAALLIDVMAGSDPKDPETRDADARRVGYADCLTQGAEGFRIGVLDTRHYSSLPILALLEQALAGFQAGGAEVIRLPHVSMPSSVSHAGTHFILRELKSCLDLYLAETSVHTGIASLMQLVEATRAFPREMASWNLDKFEAALATSGRADPDYAKITRKLVEHGMDKGFEAWFGTHNLDVLVIPSSGVAPLIDPVQPSWSPMGNYTWLAALLGYPCISVPMGAIGNLPVGLEIIARQWDDAKVLRAAYALEGSLPPLATPAFEASMGGSSEYDALQLSMSLLSSVVLNEPAELDRPAPPPASPHI